MEILVSYSRADLEFTKKLQKALEARMVSVWFDTNIMFGDKIAHVIEKQILACDQIIVVVTPNSLDSEWVNWEIDIALAANKRVIPLLLKGNSLHPQLDGRLCVDFRRNDLAERDFEKLVAQLYNPNFTAKTSPAVMQIKEVAENAYDESHLVAIKSPMVGTFYSRHSHDKPPFIKVGDVVEIGQPAYIIEAMKLFQEIESEVKGKVVKVLIEDGAPVEYEQPLFLVDPR